VCLRVPTTLKPHPGHALVLVFLSTRYVHKRRNSGGVRKTKECGEIREEGHFGTCIASNPSILLYLFFFR
jgi:hypothetical protein